MVKRRKSNYRAHYTLLDVVKASATHPMPEATRQSWLTRILLALNNIEVGDKPGVEDWRILSDAVNLTETMIDAGLVEDADGIKERGLGEMAVAGARYLEGKPMRLSGEGIQVMRALVQDVGDVMAQMPHRDMVKVHIATERRMAEIVRGKRRPGDVVVAL